MHVRSISTHLVVALVAFGLGWLTFSGGGEGATRAGAGLAGGDPAERLVEILRLDDPKERTLRLAELLESTDTSAAPRLHEVLIAEQDSGDVDEIAELMVAAWWAEEDPVAAFENIVDPAWGNRHPWVRAVFRQWVRQNPVAAAEAVELMPADPARGRLEAARVVIDQWFELEEFPDPTRLLTLVEQLEIRQRAFAIQRILNALVERRGIDATEEFVESVPAKTGAFDYDVRHELMARMAVALLDHDVQRAVAWAEKHGDGKSGPGIRKHLAYYWGLKDGPAAMEWALGLSDAADRPAVISRAWLSFGRVAPDEAHDWITQRPPSAELQAVYARFLRNLARNEPERALELAGQAEDGAVREQMLTAVGQGWMLADREAAEAWLAGAGLSPEAEQRIRQSSRRRERNAG